MLLQEAVAHNINKGESVYVAFLDIKKAFDTVWVNGLLYKLYQAGIHIKSWKIMKECYSNFQCTAYIAGKGCTWFIPERGVHQGAPLSMRLYQVFMNELLQMLKTCEYGVRIGDINVSCPASADDIAVASLYKVGLNFMLDIAYRYSIKWRFDFSLVKSMCVIWGIDHMPNVTIKFGPGEQKLVKSYKHLGITLTSDKSMSKQIISATICCAGSV